MTPQEFYTAQQVFHSTTAALTTHSESKRFRNGVQFGLQCSDTISHSLSLSIPKALPFGPILSTTLIKQVEGLLGSSAQN